MVGHNFMDEIDCGSFFDHIDDLLEFSGDDVDPCLPSAGRCNNDTFPTIWPTDSDSVFSGHNNSDFSAELSVPIEDIVQLEWLSSFVEDSFSDRTLAINKDGLKNKEDSSSQCFHTSSPVSVLESSSSSSGEKNVPRSPFSQRGRARSKRPRPATFNPPWPAVQLISPTSSVTETTTPATPEPLSDTFAESRPVVKELKHEKKKKKKVKLSLSVGPVINQVPISQPVRKCMHCEITRTPQWRAGPMGPKTLCNACGVRYKSGRLFPEYRPAASPTFVPSVHSNSHKKVVEMRNKGTMELPASPELIPNTNNAILFDYAGVAPSRNLSLRCSPPPPSSCHSQSAFI